MARLERLEQDSEVRTLIHSQLLYSSVLSNIRHSLLGFAASAQMQDRFLNKELFAQLSIARRSPPPCAWTSLLESMR